MIAISGAKVRFSTGGLQWLLQRGVDLGGWVHAW
jgi:hypothetical protein